RRQQRLVHVLYVTNLPEEISEIVSFCEAGKLGRIVKSRVDNLLDPSFQEALEEAFCGGFGKSDCRDLRFAHNFALRHRAAGSACGSANATLRARSRNAAATRCG